MRRVAVAISVALFATVALASPAYADPASDAGKNKPPTPGAGGGVSQVATGHGQTVSGLVPATPAQNTGNVASGAATTQGSAVRQAAQDQHTGNSGNDSHGGQGGSGVSDVASGLGKTISELAHTLEGDAKHDAIDEAVAQHHDAVTEAAQHHGNEAADATDTDASGSSDLDASGGGNSETARGHGADVSSLAHDTDGAKGAVVSALASTHGDIVSAAALLNSGFAPDDDADDGSQILEPTGIQLTA